MRVCLPPSPRGETPLRHAGRCPRLHDCTSCCRVPARQCPAPQHGHTIRMAEADTLGGGAWGGAAHHYARLAEGCQHIFVDAGANIGIHARFLFEPHLWPHMTAHRCTATPRNCPLAGSLQIATPWCTFWCSAGTPMRRTYPASLMRCSAGIASAAAPAHSKSSRIRYIGVDNKVFNRPTGVRAGAITTFLQPSAPQTRRP